MGFFEAQPLSQSMQMRSHDDILKRALQFNEIARRHGLRVRPWHNLGSPEPMTDGDGELLSVSAFGWTGDERWWHALASRRMSPLSDLCRYQAEPFWGNEGRSLNSRFPSAEMEKIDLDWVWTTPGTRAFLTVPVHMPLGQVGFVTFITEKADFDFEAVVDELAPLSREFVTNYVRISMPRKRGEHCEPLLAREIECLSWAFYGKTDRDIAEITGRSYATVRFYISSAGLRLGTVNRAQTLAKAAALGYFAFDA